MTDKIYGLKDKLCTELEEMGEKELTPATVDYIHKLIISIEKIMKTEVIEMELEEGYSERRGSYWHDGAVERAERRTARRSDGFNRGGGLERERRERRSERPQMRDGDKREMIDRLHRMMEDANGEYERVKIRECIASIENM